MLLEARRHRFGVKSEKFDDQFQGKLDFGDNNTDCQIAPNELPETQVPARIRKKQLKSSKVLPRRIVIILVDEKEHKQFVKDWFEGFSAAVHADADSFAVTPMQEENLKLPQKQRRKKV